MKSAVKVTAKNGVVFTPNAELGKDGKQYGYIRLEQQIVDFSSGVARVKTISALKTFSQDDFNKAQSFLKEGMELPGNIRTLETTEEGKLGYQPKMAGDTGVQCKSGSLAISRTTEYDATGKLEDVLIAHTNVEEIKAAQASKSTAALNS